MLLSYMMMVYMFLIWTWTFLISFSVFENLTRTILLWKFNYHANTTTLGPSPTVFIIDFYDNVFFLSLSIIKYFIVVHLFSDFYTINRQLYQIFFVVYVCRYLRNAEVNGLSKYWFDILRIIINKIFFLRVKE